MTDPIKKEEKLTRREQLAERFLEFPILYFVVRSWLLSWRARIGMTLGILLFVAIVLSMPRIWRVTPKEVTPEIKISVLDEAKAIVLERNAKKYLAQGREDYGIMAYRASIVHNRGNLRRLRTFLSLTTKRQLSKGAVELDTVNVAALREVIWLRKISDTPEDLDLVARLYDSMEFDDELLATLAPEKELTPPLQRMFLKALLRQGYIEQFESVWQRWEGDKTWAADEEIKLYRAAATAAYGAADKVVAAKDHLRANLEKGEHKVTANRLLEQVSFQRRDAETYLECLKRLQEWRQDRLRDHSHAWLLLAAAGRKAEALRMADQFNRAPQTAMDTSQLAAAYYELGMREDAEKLLAQFIDRFGFFERLWVQQSTLLAADKKWTDLRNLIAKMRLDPVIAHRMMGFSYYLEGRSELGEGRPAAAYELFQRITQYGIPNVEVAFVVIDKMREFGHLELSAKLVELVEKNAKDNPRYWMFVMQLADEMKNDALLLKAAEEYHRLRPDDAAAKNNLAASLLAARQRPTEAVKMTFEILSSAPHLPALQINHASALALNHRFADAAEQLDKVELARLTDLEKSMYYFVRAETLMGQDQLAAAEAAAGKIETRYVYPRQTDLMNVWKLKIEETLRPKPKAETAK